MTLIDVDATFHKCRVYAGISPALLSSVMSVFGLDKSSQHQKNAAFIFTAVVVIPLVVRQYFFINTWRSNLSYL